MVLAKRRFSLKAGIMPFQTQRLTIHPWSASPATPDDLTALLTPAVLAPLPPPLQLNTSPAEWIADREAEAETLAVHTRDGQLAGLIFLAQFESDIHIGYLLGEDFWGKGLGSELIQGLSDWLSETRSPARLLGGVAKDNPASGRILQKAGFLRDEELSDSETDMFTVRI